MPDLPEITDENVDKHFWGIRIKCNDIAGQYWVPGWQCKRCGWRVGSEGLPPAHSCSEEAGE